MLPEAELAQLADGLLPADREAELRAQALRSPQLSDALADQERAVALLRSVATPAPAELRARIDGMTTAAPAAESHRGRSRRRWFRNALILPGATALAVVIAAIVVLASGGSSAPTVPQTAHLALSAATLPPPAVDPASPGLLRISAAGIPFSNWPGWQAVGARTDVVDGRRITTVFYRAANGTRVGYAIVSGPALTGGGREGSYGVTYTLGHQGSARLVTWVRDGHTCVIAGRSVSSRTLLRLAAASGSSKPS
jgi:hypothetical protein